MSFVFLCLSTDNCSFIRTKTEDEEAEADDNSDEDADEQGDESTGEQEVVR